MAKLTRKQMMLREPIVLLTPHEEGLLMDCGVPVEFGQWWVGSGKPGGWHGAMEAYSRGERLPAEREVGDGRVGR